jgi:CBS domain-containing protein
MTSSEAAGPEDRDRRRVADVMSRAVIGIGPQTPRDEIVAALRRFGVSAVPVIDESHRPLGVVSEADLVAHWTDGAALAGGRRAKGCPVVAADLMTSPAITISASAPLVEAARLLRERNLRRLVAVHADGRVAGVVSRHDLLDT